MGHGRPSSWSSRTRSSTRSRIGSLLCPKCLLPRPASCRASSGRFGMILTMRMPSPPFSQSRRVPGAISNSRANAAGNGDLIFAGYRGNHGRKFNQVHRHPSRGVVDSRMLRIGACDKPPAYSCCSRIEAVNSQGVQSATQLLDVSAPAPICCIQRATALDRQTARHSPSRPERRRQKAASSLRIDVHFGIPIKTYPLMTGVNLYVRCRF